MTITPDRSITFTAVFNFRDLGGLPAAGGAVVRPGTVFRSDNLSRLVEADRDSFGALRIRTVIDLRRPTEVASYGRVPEWTGVVWRHNHLEHPLWDHSTYTAETGVARWLAERYLELAHHGRADIARVIGMLTDPDNGPTVVHCLAGKDRTGLIVALTLDLLGVPDEEIALDYALTGRSEAAFTRWFIQAHPDQANVPTPVVYQQTPAEAMLLTLRELRQRYGSVQEYLVGSGLQPERIGMLRERLLLR
ncbi:tyrosine-protein phosphatase [Catellatospora tritici]|uniref:tyrosine-protein phosphatase n=1 Tax=Catellatospora tritici TaxID=2851566 RepID=UPI001C2D3536|nr:tyrosine-protein phosphatase [Catellatospora tritici]MBV1854933.1 tyrosine-protein phosphatase [Catellatospora tritici]